jgi:hypothetical protein
MIGNKGKKKKKGEDRNIEDEEAQRHAICKPENISDNKKDDMIG